MILCSICIPLVILKRLHRRRQDHSFLLLSLFPSSSFLSLSLSLSLSVFLSYVYSPIFYMKERFFNSFIALSLMKFFVFFFFFLLDLNLIVKIFFYCYTLETGYPSKIAYLTFYSFYIYIYIYLAKFYYTRFR